MDIWSHKENYFGYNGKPMDKTTGLYNYGYRDYNSVQVRFTTVDPIKADNNWYAYVNNDPVNFIDPLGLDDESVAEKTIEEKINELGYYGNANEKKDVDITSNGRRREHIYPEKYVDNSPLSVVGAFTMNMKMKQQSTGPNTMTLITLPKIGSNVKNAGDTTLYVWSKSETIISHQVTVTLDRKLYNGMNSNTIVGVESSSGDGKFEEQILSQEVASKILKSYSSHLVDDALSYDRRSTLNKVVDWFKDKF